VKRVNDWLQSTTADSSQNEAKPNLAGGGQRVVRKVVDDRDD
jgi:hypothetical protein